MGIERINDSDINKIFNTVVNALSKEYLYLGGGDTLALFEDSQKKFPFKVFIRDIKTIDEPHIIIRKS